MLLVRSFVLVALTVSAGMTSRMRRYTCVRRQGTLCAMRSVPSIVATTMGTLAFYAILSEPACQGSSLPLLLRVPSG